MNERLQLLAAASVFIMVTTYLYRRHSFKTTHDRVIYRGGDFPSFIRTISPEVFEAHTDWGPWGLNRDSAPRHLLMTEEQCERVLTENAQSHDVLPAHGKEEGEGRRGRVVRWEVDEVGSNKPNEDAWAVDVIRRDLLKQMLDRDKNVWESWAYIKLEMEEEQMVRGEERVMIFTMIDGHGGNPSVAQVIKRTLHLKLAQDLADVFTGDVVNEIAVAQTIKSSLIALDDEILAAPLTLLKKPIDPALEAHYPLALTQLMPLENAGACVTTAIIDESTNKLYVANIGDCRAVAGWIHPKTGVWRCDVLSEVGDQDYDNPIEEKRLRDAHPHDDQSTILTAPGKGLRLFGVQNVSRLIGDAFGKRTIEDTRAMSEYLGVTYLSKGKPYVSPPYLSNEPEVVVRDLSPDTGEKLGFVILATDGLWGFMSSEEAALLVAAAIDDDTPRTVTKNDLPLQHPFTASDHRPFPVEELPGGAGWKSKGSWGFQDYNLALHLTRNALGRGDAWERRRLLSMKDNGHRLFRDDITVAVVRFDQ